MDCVKLGRSGGKGYRLAMIQFMDLDKVLLRLGEGFFYFLFLFIIAKELQTQFNKVMNIESRESGHVTSHTKINRETVD